jgi:hypothetical protein
MSEGKSRISPKVMDDFHAYLEELQVSSTVAKSSHDAIKRMASFSPEPIESFILENTLTRDGEEIFEALDCFTKNYVLCAQDFLRKDEYQFALLRRSIRYLEVIATDYDFYSSNGKSQLTVEFEIGISSAWHLTGARDNCDFLHRVIKERLLPNLSTNPARNGVETPYEE